MKVYFKTFGCRTNIYDSEVMKNALFNHSICDDENKADIIVVNSCTVTNGADSDVRNYINRMDRAGKKVLLTGCGAKNRGEDLLKSGKVQGVFAMSRKLEINDFITRDTKFMEFGDTDKIESVSSFTSHSKAFLKIQEGCNFKCSYCIIPYVRGKARSKDELNLINEAKSLVDNGFSELVLTGTNIGSYGDDTNSNLAALLKKLSQIQGLKRIRLGSLEPSQIDSEFKEILDESWLEKHLHIALQHTSQKMLTLMSRRNKALRDIELFNFLANKGFALGTDFIVGHPGESEEIWEEAMQNLKKFPITHIHAFIYSKRDGTKSADMLKEFGEINGKISKARLKELQNIVALNNLNFRKNNKNVILDILVEHKNGKFWSGFDQFYNKILIKSDQFLEHQWIKVDRYEIKDSANFAQF